MGVIQDVEQEAKKVADVAKKAAEQVAEDVKDVAGDASKVVDEAKQDAKQVEGDIGDAQLGKAVEDAKGDAEALAGEVKNDVEQEAAKVEGQATADVDELVSKASVSPDAWHNRLQGTIW